MRILGLHFDRPFVRWAVLEHKSKKFSIHSLKSIVSDGDVKRLYISERRDRIATSMKTMVRHLDFKFLSKKKIAQGLRFQIEGLTHLPYEELVFSEKIVPHEQGAKVTLFLSPKQALCGQLKEWNDLSIYPDLMTSTSEALFQFVQYRAPNFGEGFVIHLGSEEWTCLWIGQGQIKKSFVIDGGVELLLSSLWEDRKKVLFPTEVNGVAKQIDLLHLKSHLNPKLFEQLKEMRNKLHAALSAFQSEGEVPVFFTGRTDAFGQFCPYLLESSACLLYEPPMPLNAEESKCAIAIGSALESVARKQIQFLKGDFVPARQWRQAGLWGLSLLSCSVILSAVCWFSGWKYYNSEKEQVASTFQKMIERMDQPLSKSIFAAGIDEGIVQSALAIQKYDKEAPYLVQAPMVSEVLAWLSQKDALEILDLRYKLVSQPHIGALKEPYLAKVEVEFRAESMASRHFHEELLNGNHLVDANQEIGWEKLPDGYRATFSLKNRVPYVP